MAKLSARITYCLPCGHQPHAIQLANQLLGDYGMKFNREMELTLVPVDKGEFDVYVNGEKVFSRHEAQRMPTAEEIKKPLSSALPLSVDATKRGALLSAPPSPQSGCATR